MPVKHRHELGHDFCYDAVRFLHWESFLDVSIFLFRLYPQIFAIPLSPLHNVTTFYELTIPVLCILDHISPVAA
jgi:hypothetical protein